jgi:helicase SWR1
VEQRQALTDRFNNDNRILAFILSSRSGGLGINLTGADTVIFYDLDWNPAMDKQCQDRCHRIGQTREVHIYRFVSEYTIESNILRKANQKRMLDDVIIQEGEFTTDYFNKLGVREMIEDDLLDGDAQANAAMDRVLGGGVTNTRMLEAVEEREDAVAAKQAEREVEHADDGDFEEKSVSQSGVGTPKTPLPLTPRDMIAGASTNAPTPIETEGDTIEASTSLDAAQSGLVDPTHIPGVNRAEEEDKMGHFDDYLLKLVEWTFRDVPIAPPIDKSKKKAKKGQEHRITRVR